MKSWDDLKRLNRALITVVEKFALLDQPNEKIELELKKYLHDFEVIQVGLGNAQQATISHASHFEELQAEVRLEVAVQSHKRWLEQLYIS